MVFGVVSLAMVGLQGVVGFVVILLEALVVLVRALGGPRGQGWCGVAMGCVVGAMVLVRLQGVVLVVCVVGLLGAMRLVVVGML